MYHRLLRIEATVWSSEVDYPVVSDLDTEVLVETVESLAEDDVSHLWLARCVSSFLCFFADVSCYLGNDLQDGFDVHGTPPFVRM